MGLISAFVFAATIAVIPAEADNSIDVSDDDSLAQDNSAKIPQDADNDVVISGIGNTGAASIFTSCLLNTKQYPHGQRRQDYYTYSNGLSRHRTTTPIESHTTTRKNNTSKNQS